MKNTFKILILLLLVSVCSFAQKTINNPLTHKNIQKIDFISLTNIDINENANLSESNSIIIEQIGNYNSISSSVSSKTSNIGLYQMGSFNDITFNVSADIIYDSVLQYGNNNSFSINSISDNDFHNIEIIQRGNDQNLIWFGDNLISEKLKITMQGHSKTLIVKNYK